VHSPTVVRKICLTILKARMTEYDAVEVLDGLCGTGGGIFAVAWQILRAKLMESTNSSHNSASAQLLDELALLFIKSVWLDGIASQVKACEIVQQLRTLP